MAPLPAEAEAEQALLGACLLNTRAVEVALEEVTAEDFARPSHRLIYEAVHSLTARLQAVDPVTVAAELGQNLKACGGRDYVFSLSGLCPLVGNAADYARAVREASVERRARALYEQVCGNGKRGREFVAALETGLLGLERPEAQAPQTMTAALETLYETAQRPSGRVIAFPWSQVQHWTRGLRPGWLGVLCGEAKAGKTALALGVVENALKNGFSVLFDTLEMSGHELAVRVAQRVGMDSDRYFLDRAETSDYEAILSLIREPMWGRFSVVSTAEPDRLVAIARRLRPDLVVVDYLQLMRSDEKAGRVESTTRNVYALKWDLARRLDTAVLCLSQLSRDRTQRGKLPTADRLRDSGAIEATADWVLAIWRKRDENDEFISEGTVAALASRHGPTGLMRVHFDAERLQIRSLTTTEAQIA